MATIRVRADLPLDALVDALLDHPPDEPLAAALAVVLMQHDGLLPLVVAALSPETRDDLRRLMAH
jgi:hypothetical protein